MKKGKPKPKPIPVTDEVIAKASKTNAVRALVQVSRAYMRTEVDGPFEVELPAYVSAFIGGEKNQYRKWNLPMSKSFNLKDISLGKKVGLIFILTPAFEAKRETFPVEQVELTWDDFCSCFADVADKLLLTLEEYTGGAVNIADLNAQIKDTIAKNPSMHKIMLEGFANAMKDSREIATDEAMEGIEGYGMF